MQRPLLIGALVAIALTGIGGGIWVLTRPNEPQVDTAPADTAASCDTADTTRWWPDADGDGWGDASAAPTWACAAPAGFVAYGADCDDADASAYPRAADPAGDGVDQDCDGADVEAEPTWDCGAAAVRDDSWGVSGADAAEEAALLCAGGPVHLSGLSVDSTDLVDLRALGVCVCLVFVAPTPFFSRTSARRVDASVTPYTHTV